MQNSEAEYQRVIGLSSSERTAVMNNLLGKCNHAIKVPGCHYEIGLVKAQQDQKYLVVYDWYATGGLHKVMGSPNDSLEDAKNPLLAAYTVEALKMSAEQQGYAWSEKCLGNGEYEVEVVKAY